MASRQQTDTAAQLVKELLTKPKTGEIEYILCRRNFPYVLKSPQWDPMWEGLRIVTRNGVKVLETDPAFNLKIELDGTCKIPKTESNIRKLDRISKEQVTTRTVKRFDPIKNAMADVKETVVAIPEYERLQKSIIEDDLIKRIAQAVAEMNKPVETVDKDAQTGKVFERSDKTETGSANTGTFTTSGMPRRGRPPKNQKIPAPA